MASCHWMEVLLSWRNLSVWSLLHLCHNRDARGMTPFMLAVSGRAYPAAITVLEAAQKMAKGKFISHLYTFGKLILRVIANPHVGSFVPVWLCKEKKYYFCAEEYILSESPLTTNTVLSGSVNPRRCSWLAALLLTKETHCNLSFSVFTFPLWPEMCRAQWETQALQKRRMLILCLWKWFAPRGPIQTTRRSTFSAAMTPAVSLGLELSTLIRSAATEGKNVWKRGKNLAPPFGVTLLRQQLLIIKKDEVTK